MPSAPQIAKYAAGLMVAVTALFASIDMVLIGLVLGFALYGAVLWLTHALAPSEREILQLLIRWNA